MSDSGFDIDSIMKNAKNFLNQTQNTLHKIVVCGESGAGMVTVTMNAERQALKVTIEDELLKESKEIITDLVCAAINDATHKVNKATKDRILSFADKNEFKRE